MAPTESTTLLGGGGPRRPANSNRWRSVTESTEQPASSSTGRECADYAGERKLLTTWQLLMLTVLLAGIQFVWTVELGYGTPYLLSLGLSKPLMTLVWMAGPLSGLIIQPVVGRLSDRCTSALGRRRPFIIGGAAFVVTAVIMIAYARQMAVALAHILRLAGSGAPGSEFQVFVTRVTIVIAVVGFYILDFSINTSQACARALALDIPPLQQQDLANAYAGRMLNLGSVSGYMVGFIDLHALLPWKTDSQMQALCLIAIAVFTLTITLTCVCVREVPLRVAGEIGVDSQLVSGERGQPAAIAQYNSENVAQSPRSEWADMVRGITHGMAKLPTPVQRVCNVQFFAWIAWFPFLFFATTWVTEIMARTGDITDPEFIERATRAGSFALFLYSVASLGFSVLVPLLVEDEAAESTLHPRPGRMKVSLRAMWRISLVAMGLTLLSTRFVGDVRAATVLIIAMAFPWALALWAPFALVGEYVAIASQQPADAHPPASNADIVADAESALAKTAALKMPGVRGMGSTRRASPGGDDSEDDEDYIVGSQTTATGMAGTAPAWRRSHELLGQSPAMHLALLHGDSIASTIQLDEDSGGAPSASSSPPVLGTQPLHLSPPTRPALRLLGNGQNRVVSLASTSTSALPPTSTDEVIAETEPSQQHDRLESGTILGIHNMYVVFPQFAINAISTLIFAWLGGGAGSNTRTASSNLPIRSVEFMAMDAVFARLSGGADIGGGGDVIGLVLRIGGTSALVAAAMTSLLFDRQRIRAYAAEENRR